MLDGRGTSDEVWSDRGCGVGESRERVAEGGVVPGSCVFLALKRKRRRVKVVSDAAICRAPETSRARDASRERRSGAVHKTRLGSTLEYAWQQLLALSSFGVLESAGEDGNDE